MTVKEFQYSAINLAPSITKIELGQDVLGGNEALQFASLLEDISKQKIKNVIIDLKNVKIMNSSGLGMLVNALSSLKQNNIKLILVSVPEKIMNLLKMTHLIQVFIINPDLESAIKKCS